MLFLVKQEVYAIDPPVGIDDNPMRHRREGKVCKGGDEA